MSKHPLLVWLFPKNVSPVFLCKLTSLAQLPVVSLFVERHWRYLCLGWNWFLRGQCSLICDRIRHWEDSFLCGYRDAPNVLFDFSRMGTIIVLDINGQSSSQTGEKPGNRTENGPAAWRFSGEKLAQYYCHVLLQHSLFVWPFSGLKKLLGWWPSAPKVKWEWEKENRREKSNFTVQWEAELFWLTLPLSENLGAPLGWPWPLTLWIIGYLLTTLSSVTPDESLENELFLW